MSIRTAVMRRVGGGVDERITFCVFVFRLSGSNGNRRAR